MSWSTRSRRWAWTLVALALVAAVAVILGPRLGSTRGAPAPLWTDRRVAAAPGAVAPPDWVGVAKALKPAVVNISTRRTLPAPSGDRDPFEEFFERFLGGRPHGEVRSLGSGVIVNADGDILTNNHVVDAATEIRVRLADGRELPARVIGRDATTDLALLKVDATGLPVIPLGDSTRLQVGEPVMAIGNPFGLEQTVTTGIVSATGRVIGEGPYDEFIQTDASINPGNSGGPLINAEGQAIGITTAIFTRTGGSVGIGFAIPSNVAKSVVTQLAESGRVVRGWLGVSLQELNPDLAKSFALPDTHGALVSSVADGSPAMKAGLEPGDVITAYDWRPVARADELPRAVAATAVGRQVPVTLVRKGKTLTLTVTVGRLVEAAQETAAAPAETSRLGMSLQSLTPAIARELGVRERHGVLIRDVEETGSAARAGLQRGDVLVEVEHHPVDSASQVRQLAAAHRAGTPLLLLVHRDDHSLYVAVPS